MAQVSIVRSTILTNRDAYKPNDLRTAGRNFQKRARVLCLAADNATSQYGFFSVPANAVLVSCELSMGAGGTSATMDLGFWEVPNVGGWSATTGWATQAGSVTGASQYFGAGIDVSGALAKSQQLYAGSGYQTLSNTDQMLWQVLGLTADPQREYDLVGTVAVAMVNAVSILVELSYKLV